MPKINRPLDLVLLDVLWETEGSYEIGVNLYRRCFVLRVYSVWMNSVM